MKRLIALCLGLLLVLLGATSAIAAQPLKLQLLTTSAQITPGSTGLSSTSITVVVSGSNKARVSLEVVDLVLDKTGKSPVPAGSTKYTLVDQLKFEPEYFNYTPSKAPQKYIFKVSATQSNLKEVRYGGIQSLLSSNENVGEVSSKIAAITTFAIVPKGLSLSLGDGSIKSTQISDLRLVQKSKRSLADWIFPDIPGIANQAPVTLEAKLENKNDLPIFTTQEITWANDAKKIKVSSLPQRLLFADQEINLSQDSTKFVSNSSVQKNFVKPFESIKVQITFSTFLGGQTLKPISKEVSVLVFPWKEILFWTLILALVVWQLIRGRRKMVSRIEPNIVWLFLVWVVKGAARKIKSFTA